MKLTDALLAFPLFALCLLPPSSAQVANDSLIESALAEAGTNRTEIVGALNAAPEAQREGVQFLVQNMPSRDIPLIDTPLLARPSQICYAPPPLTRPLKSKDEARLRKALAEYFSAAEEKRAKWKFSGALKRLLRDNEPAVRQAAWETYCKAPIHDSMKQNFGTNYVRFESYLSP